MIKLTQLTEHTIQVTYNVEGSNLDDAVIGVFNKNVGHFRLFSPTPQMQFSAGMLLEVGKLLATLNAGGDIYIEQLCGNGADSASNTIQHHDADN